MLLGEWLLSLHADAVIRVWDARAAVAEALPAAGAARTRQLPVIPTRTVRLPESVRPMAWLHPDTYVNKVAIGTADGSVLIVNVRSGAIVHTCERVASAAIISMAQSPVVDVIGVGSADGHLVLHNLKLDAHITRFSHASHGSDDGSAGAVTAVTFASEGQLAFPAVVSATSAGALAVWNLESRSLAAALPVAHDGAILFAGFLPRQPCVLTAGADNSVQIWQVDRIGGAPQVLRARAGHAAPPRLLRYYGGAAVASLASGANAAACEIASGGGSDRALRAFHTALDAQGGELSQGHLAARARALGVHANALRLAPISALAVSDRRRGQWSDVVTAHAGSSVAHTWAWDTRKISDVTLAMPNSSESITALAISTCGHFAVAGGSRGSVIKFGLQTGARRGAFPMGDPADYVRIGARGPKRGGLYADAGAVDRPRRHETGAARNHSGARAIDSIATAIDRTFGLEVTTASQGTKRLRNSAAGGHTSSVYGVAVDALNSTLISADATGKLLFWDFATAAQRGALVLPAGCAALVMHRDSGLVAILCDDFVTRIVDVSTRRLVRTLVGHTNRLSDAAFTPDARWLLTASLDGSIRVWDVPSGRCIDWFAFDAAPVALAISPGGEHLVTAHVGERGLAVWANRDHYGTAGAGAASGTAPNAPVRMDLPTTVAADDNGSNAMAPPATSDAVTTTAPAPLAPAPSKPIVPRTDTRITLSTQPTSVWVNLSRLQAIAARNKPVAPPTKPPSAPFFLPTTGGLAPSFVPPTMPVPNQGHGDAHDHSFDEGGDNAEASEDRHLAVIRGPRQARGPLADALRAMIAAGNDEDSRADAVSAAATFLTTQGPAAVDAAVRSLCLGLHDDHGVALVEALLIYFERSLGANGGVPSCNYELTQAQLQLTLAVYADVIATTVMLQNAAGRVLAAHRPDAERLRSMLDRALCMVSTFLGQT